MSALKGPLDGVKVLDFTRVYSGPYCTMLLADLGAEVIKVEMPGSGDDTRSFLPFKNGESGYFMYLNRNKKGMTLNLKSDEGKALVMELAQWADVLVENFSPGVMEKLGLDYETVKKVNPEIIYASISGFGQTGPYKNKVAYDAVAQAMGGLTYVTGHPDRPPVKVGPCVADANAGIHMAFGISSALYNRKVTGKGQHIDVSMMDAVFSILENYVVKYTIDNENPERNGNENMTVAPFDSYPTKDDYVVIATANDKLYVNLAKAIGRDDILGDERFATNFDRKTNYGQLKPIIVEWTEKHTTEEVVEILESWKIPVAPIMSMDKLVVDPQIEAREMLVDIDHPVAGTVKYPGNPIKYSETKATIRSHSPVLGQHNEEVLRDVLGKSDSEIERLKESNIV